MTRKPKTQMEKKRAQVLSLRKSKLKLTEFSPQETSICGRTAEFLNWARVKYPHQTVTYEEITQAIFSLGRLPDLRSRHVRSVRNQMYSAAKKLIDVYNTTLITEKGVGARAAVNDADILENSVPKAVERHRQTADALGRTAAQVHPEALKKQLASLPDDKAKTDLLALAKWFNEDLIKYVRKLKQPQQTAALLPPPPVVTE